MLVDEGLTGRCWPVQNCAGLCRLVQPCRFVQVDATVQVCAGLHRFVCLQDFAGWCRSDQDMQLQSGAC